MPRSNLSFFSATVALAGFLFGFDTVVISGANLPIKKLWHTSLLFHGTFIMLFIASHAVGQGAGIWVFISEIFPDKVRAWGQSQHLWFYNFSLY